MKKTKRIRRVWLIYLLTFVCCACFACVPLPRSPNLNPPQKPHRFTEEDFLRAENGRLKNGLSQSVTLKGTNAGGYLVVEQWMTALLGSEKTGYLDHKTTTEIFTARFGKERTIQLWAWYRSCFWTEQDFVNCANMGMNVIRLPFTYMNVDPDYNNVPAVEGKKYNFSVLDNFIRSAERYGIYTVLDLHGAYGSQNGQDHSGESVGSADDVDFYANEEKMSKTVDLWAALAEHYNGDPAVAAYDILNEPGEKAGLTSARHFSFFNRVYKAIRATDFGHVVIFESCWDGENLPAPNRYGWSNCMYSFHNYTGSDDYAVNLASMRKKLDGVEKMDFRVPNYMGEFNCYANEKSWRDTLKLFNDNRWSWTSWTYKLNVLTQGAYPGWGIYHTFATPVTPDVDSYDTVIEKWSHLRSNLPGTGAYAFPSGNTLIEVLFEACQAEKK